MQISKFKCSYLALNLKKNHYLVRRKKYFDNFSIEKVCVCYSTKTVFHIPNNLR